MMATLVGKLLRDVRLALLLVCVLLAGYQTLWAKISERVSGQLMPQLAWLAKQANVSLDQVEHEIFEGPGRIVKTLIGGENISLFRVKDALSIGYVHPLTQVILCVWAIGRAAGAIAGELDRGTMELLLAQPVPRYRVILAHFCVDVLTILLLCLSLWAGNWLGVWFVGPHEVNALTNERGSAISPMIFWPALPNVAALLFALSGFTMWLSARGRFRGRVLGAAVFIILFQFLVNLIGQIWDAVAVLRPFTVFFYYQPQQIILNGLWSADLGTVWNGVGIHLNVIAVLATVGVIGYGLALWTFCRRDLPAPL
jgi:ABC-2 type transport system permease protein